MVKEFFHDPPRRTTRVEEWWRWRRINRLARVVYESAYPQNSRAYSSVTHDQNADHERRIAVLERTVEGLLDLDLRMTQSHGDYKRLLRELQLAGVPLQRFGRDKAEDDLRKT